MPALGHHDGRGLQLRRCGRGGGGGDGNPRDRVPRGLRPRCDGDEPLRGAARSDRARALRPCPTRRVPARAVHVHRRAVRGLRGARPSHGDAPRRERRGACVPARRLGRLVGVRDMLVPPPGTTGIRLLAEAGLARQPACSPRTASTSRRTRSRSSRAHGVGVAHCPRSNGILGCGIAPLGDLLAAGLAVGIATDSPASTPSFDLFDELRTAIVVARARERRPGRAQRARQALELATLGGARVLGLDREVGSLVPGKWADLTIVSLEGSPLSPVEDPVVAAVLGGVARPGCSYSRSRRGPLPARRERMARFEKSSPKSAKSHAAVAPPRQRGSTASGDRGHDVLPAAAAPCEVDVRVPRARVRARLRRVRRRCRRHRVSGDIFRDSSGSAGQSISDARKETEQTARRTRRRGATTRRRSRPRGRPRRRSPR